MHEQLAPIDSSLRIGSVRLAVSDLPRSTDFYERVLGLPLLSREPDAARLGMQDDHPLLELRALERPTPIPPGSSGLFHVAWLHPSRGSLADTVQRVADAGWPLDGAADHGVSEALYLSDPDGLGIEIYADRPREQWERPPGGQGVVMRTLPLDLEGLMASASREPSPAMARGVVAGHVHLKVADVARAVAFYDAALGMEEQARMPSAAFLSAGGYHHHIGLNSWHSRGGSPPPDSAPGLRLVEFELGDANAVEALGRRLSEGPGGTPPGRGAQKGLTVSDPDRHELAFRY